VNGVANQSQSAAIRSRRKILELSGVFMRFWSEISSFVGMVVMTAILVPATCSAQEASNHADPHDDGHEKSVPSMTLTKQETDLAVWSAITFLVFLVVLKRFAWGPLIEGLDRREGSILDNIASAEASRIKAERMLAEHAAKLEKVQDEVREILAEAKRDAEHTKTEIMATAQKEAEATRQRAVHDIERARDQALDELFNQVGRVVYQATEQVLGRSVTTADNDRLIEEALSSFAQRKHP
jgi:F-type H+-transporting ATPase subunit b